MSNSSEYLAGTNPRDASSTIRLNIAPRIGGTNAVLSFTAEADRSYLVRRRTSLDAGDWERLIEVPAGPARRSITLTNELLAVPAQFYRALIPMPP